jgi:hypothetical protein
MMTKGKEVAVILKERVYQGRVFILPGLIKAGIIVAVYDRALRVKYTDAEGNIVSHTFTRRINGLYLYDLDRYDELTGFLFCHSLAASNDGRRLLSPKTAFRRALRTGRFEVI